VKRSQVYQLVATGTDWVTACSHRTMYSLTVYPTWEAAESRVERFREILIEKNMFVDDDLLEIKIKTLELIEDE